MRIKLPDGTGYMILKHVVEDVDARGNIRVYFKRRGFKKKRLHAIPGSEAFMAEYRAALVDQEPILQKPTMRLDSMRWLSAQYLASPEYLKLSRSTKEMRRLHLDRVNLKHGDNPFARMKPRHVRTILEDYADIQSAGNNARKTLLALFKWAIRKDYMDHNPARDTERYEVVTEGFHTWTREEILQFLSYHPYSTKGGLALAIGLHTGARRCDAVKLGRQMETKDGWLRFTETKGRKKVVKVTDVLITEDFRAVLNMHQGPRLTYLVTEQGRPFTDAGFGNWFRDLCYEANLPGCTFHGLRKARATIAAENGASEHEIMTLLGHTTPRLASLYTGKVNRRKLAASAGPLVRLQDQDENE